MADLARIRFFRWWAGVVHRSPRAVLAVSALFAVAGVALSLAFLEFRANRSELLSPHLEWNQRFEWWAAHFPGGQDLFVIVDTVGEDGRDARPEAVALVEELGPALRAAGHVEEAVWGFDPAAASAKAIRLLPPDAFEDRVTRLEQAEAIARSETLGELLGRAMGQMGAADGLTDAAAAAEGLGAFERLLGAIGDRLALPADTAMDLERAIEPPTPPRYFETANGRLLIIRVAPEAVEGGLSTVTHAIASVRGVLADFRERYPGVPFGLTGGEVVEADETDAAMRDATGMAALAVVLILAVLVLAFRSAWEPVFLLATILIGMAWSFGFVTLVIGHLQVISVVFTLILLGLGAGFGIHLASAYELIRPRHPDDADGFRNALAETMATTGPALVAGGVTTAAAFVTTVFTDFRGVGEMGLISGAGVLLCLAAFFTVYPALLRLLRSGQQQVRPVEERSLVFFDERWFVPFTRRPRLMVTVSLTLGVLALLGAGQMRFDYNLLALLPRGVESVVWQQRVVEDGEQSPYFAVSIAESLDEARQRVEAFRALPSVQSVGGVALLFPENEAAKLARLEAARAALAPALAEAAPPAAGAASATAPGDGLLDRLSALRLGLGLVRGRAPGDLREPLDRVIARLDAALAEANRLPIPERDARLAALHRDYARWRGDVVSRLHEALDPSPLRPADLPPGVLAPYIAAGDGKTHYQIDVYPMPSERAADALDPTMLRRFIGEARTVDPALTGVIVQVYESGTLIWRSYLLAGAAALGIVFALVWLDFRSLIDASLTLLPVALGFAITFALLWLLGEQVNPANIIVLPLMFGIGVDNGVHMIHRNRLCPHDRPRGLTRGTGKGITITALVEIIGFASMLIAAHRGIFSLGLVLALGLTITLLTCLTMMPAWLEFRHGSPGGGWRAPRSSRRDSDPILRSR